MPSAEIDAYIDQLPEEAQRRMNEMRLFWARELPQAQECFKWHMPTLFQHENLLHFVAFKKHLGVFPGPDGVRFFESLRSDYPTSKGTIQIPYDRDIPWNELAKLGQFRCQKAQEKSALKQSASRKINKT